jgi:tetratricopeptide (TPR) repeat protein
LTVGLRLAQEVLARPSLQRRDEARCMALFAAGQLSNFMGRHAAADAFLLECLAIARETDNAAVVARVLQPLGISSRAQGDFVAASRYLDEALVLAREQGNLREVAAALNALAMLHRMQGRLDLAEPLCVSIIETARAIGDLESAGIGLVNLAMVLIASGEPSRLARTERARPLLVEVTELAEQTGSLHMHHSAVVACAGYAAALRSWRDAALFYGAAQAQQEAAALSRDTADETFLEAQMAAVAEALGAEEFGTVAAAGRSQSALIEPTALRQWLAHAAAPEI